MIATIKWARIVGSPLNLLYAKVDEPAFFDAMERGNERTVAYAVAVEAFVEQASEFAFNKLVQALLSLPTRTGGAVWIPGLR